MEEECKALGLVNLEKRRSQADSFCFGSFVTDDEPAIGMAKARKWGISSRLCFSANNEHSLRAARSWYSYDWISKRSWSDWSYWKE